MILQAWQFCDEDVLIFRTQIGEQSAFDSLVSQYLPKIEALLMRQVHHRETAEDLAQETFVKAFSRINTFRGDCAFYTWLYQIAQNVCIDYHRRQQARAKTFSSEAIDDSLIGTDTHPCPSQLMEQKELRAIVRTSGGIAPAADASPRVSVALCRRTPDKSDCQANQQE